MNLLKLKTMIHCNTCGRALKRNKTIKIQASTPADTFFEAARKIDKWKESLKGKNCKVCQSIIDETINQDRNFKKICWQCENAVNYLFKDGRCWKCTRAGPDSI